MTTEEFNKLATEIRGSRRRGKVWIKRVALGRSTTETAHARADDIVTSLNLRPSPVWYDISRSEAEEGAASILHRDLAYDSVIMPANDASRLARGFLGFFTTNGDVKYFTNGTLIKPSRKSGRSWNGITGATFDCGIIVVAENSIGILWIADED
eukprot:g17687.t1